MIRTAILGVVCCLAAGLARPVPAAERITLVTPLNTVDTVISEVIVREAYRRIGIKVEIRQSQDGLDYQRRIRSGDYDMVLGGWNADTDDTHDFVEALSSEPAPEKPNQTDEFSLEPPPEPQ